MIMFYIVLFTGESFNNKGEGLQLWAICERTRSNKLEARGREGEGKRKGF